MTEREQLVQDWRDNYASRGGIANDESEKQAAAYADRILEGRAETERMIAAARQAEQTRANVAVDHALRLRGERKRIIADFINRHTSDGYAVTEVLKQQAAIFADRVLEQADPRVQQRALEVATKRLAAGRAMAAADVERLEPIVRDWANGDETIPAIRATLHRMRHALDEIDARLFRRAMRPDHSAPRSEDRANEARTASGVTVFAVATKDGLDISSPNRRTKRE